jgi:hypothetical protein
MWYRSAFIGGGAVSPQQQAIKDMTNQMSDFVLEQGRELDEYYAEAKTDQADLWTHLVERDHAVGFDGMDHPGYTNPEETTIENQLEPGRHQSNNTNMQEQEATNGFMLTRGIDAYNSGKGALMYKSNMPSSVTLI